MTAWVTALNNIVFLSCTISKRHTFLVDVVWNSIVLVLISFGATSVQQQKFDETFIARRLCSIRPCVSTSTPCCVPMFSTNKKLRNKNEWIKNAFIRSNLMTKAMAAVWNKGLTSISRVRNEAGVLHWTNWTWPLTEVHKRWKPNCTCWCSEWERWRCSGRAGTPPRHCDGCA